MGSLKKIIQALNQPIGGSKGNDKAKREKNLKLKVMELTPQDAIKKTNQSVDQKEMIKLVTQKEKKI